MRLGKVSAHEPTGKIACGGHARHCGRQCRDINGGAGVTFGDGLRCAGQNVVRLQIVTADGAGVARSTSAIAAGGGVSAGQTRRYQWWYRDPLLTVCGSGFNLSNGLRLTWTL